jgi:hypothetical protein
MKKMVDAGVSVNKAANLLAEMAAKQIGDELYSAEAIRARYRLHIGEREPNPKAGHNDQPKNQKPQKASDSCSLPVNQVQLELPLGVGPKDFEPDKENISPKMKGLGAGNLVENKKAVATARQPRPSELEKVDQLVQRADRILEMFVAGQIKDNGTDIDRLAAASIVRHGPGIIISLIRLGIDISKVYEFCTGRKDGSAEVEIEIKEFQVSESDFTMQENLSAKSA